MCPSIIASFSALKTSEAALEPESVGVPVKSVKDLCSSFILFTPTQMGRAGTACRVKTFGGNI